MFKMIY